MLELSSRPKHELFTLVLALDDTVQQTWIGGAILRRFGEKLNDDELEFIVIHVNGNVALQAAEILLARSIDPKVLGVIAQYCPEFQDPAWEKVQDLFPATDRLARNVFLGFCPELRLRVREEEFWRKNSHLDRPRMALVAPAK